MFRAAVSVFLFVLFLHGPSQAQNLVANPDFDIDTSGWEAPGDLDLSHSSGDGFAAPGAAEVTGVLISPPFSNSTGLLQCIPLGKDAPTTSLAVSAVVKMVNFDGFMPQIVITTHSDVECFSAPLDQQNVSGFLVQGIWGELQGMLSPFPVETQSIRLTVMVSTDSSDSGLTVRVDDAFFGVPVLFEDGFESGDTSNWSLAVP